ncbi:uncharacterized protein LOC113464351 [Ceratina calcarata]|uniref:Uncharacterized protein LOC113464351 n=1 Tax=Ceratina calcarata TaxID=156304 RepID=A0AAJ7S0X4_9HYME|nr:uncharacterized protein LOC113464351 [Ceratina calcarata]
MRSEWKNGRPYRFNGWNTWFTDGSKDDKGETGCAWVSDGLTNDSQAAIKTMEKSCYKSVIALECFDRLNELASVNKRVVLCWCPGHRGIPGNEEADRLAKIIVEEKRPGLEPWLPVPYADFKS